MLNINIHFKMQGTLFTRITTEQAKWSDKVTNKQKMKQY